jgi:hypothetical protein
VVSAADPARSLISVSTPVIIIITTTQNLDMFKHVLFEGFTAVTVKNALFWDVTPCGSCIIIYRLHHQVEKSDWEEQR